jgi:hypothetical protein
MRRCHRARNGNGMDLGKRKDVDEAPGAYVYSCQLPNPPLCCSARPIYGGARTHFDPWTGQASKTTICSGSRGLRQCAEALDGVSGVSTGKRYRKGETTPFCPLFLPGDRRYQCTAPVPGPRSAKPSTR